MYRILLLLVLYILTDGQKLEYVQAPGCGSSTTGVWIRQPQATTKNTIAWLQSTYNKNGNLHYNIEYYLFSKDLSGQDQVYHIVPPIDTLDSSFDPAVQQAHLKMIYPMDPNSPIWMMAYFPSENCLYPGQNNCPYSISNATCTIHYTQTPGPTPVSKSPTPCPIPSPTKYPTPAPVPVPTKSPTNQIILATSTTSKRATYQSS
eukprot:311110_1